MATASILIKKMWWITLANPAAIYKLYCNKKWIKDVWPRWNLQNDEEPSTNLYARNVSTVTITWEWYRTTQVYQYSYNHYRMVRDRPVTSAQLWSQENGERPSSNIVQLQSLSLRHATRSRKDTDGHNIPQAKQNVQHRSYYLKHHFTEWIATLFVTSTEG